MDKFIDVYYEFLNYLSEKNPKIIEDSNFVKESNKVFNKGMDLEKRVGEDPLTKAKSRYAYDDFKKIQNSKLLRGEGPLTLLVVDFDKFKEYNDTLGHQAGDKALKQFVQIAKETLRPSDEIYKVGGEEFVIPLGGKDKKVGYEVAERLRKKIGEECDFTISVGVSDSYTAGNTLEKIFDNADKALYEAKDERNKVVVYSSEDKYGQLSFDF